jgi:archaellum component FlaC
MTENQFKTILTQTLLAVEKRLDKIDESLGVHNNRFDDIAEHLRDQDARFNTFANAVGERFDQIDEHFEKVDERFEEVGRQFKKVDSRFNKIDIRFDSLETELKNKADGGTVYNKLAQITNQ